MSVITRSHSPSPTTDDSRYVDVSVVVVIGECESTLNVYSLIGFVRLIVWRWL